MGYEMLKALRMQEDCEIHLVITQGARENFKYRDGYGYPGGDGAGGLLS